MLNTFGRKYGRVKVGVAVVEDTEIMHELFQHFIPLQIDWSRTFLDDVIIYAGYSPDFEEFEIDEGEVPVYMAVFKSDPATLKTLFDYFERA